jgi:hypothetical protein
MYQIPRRELLKGGAALTAAALLNASRTDAYSGRPGEAVIRWLDQPTKIPIRQGFIPALIDQNP